MAVVKVRVAEALLVYQVALIWFENCVHFPLRPTSVLLQILDAFPSTLAGVPASIAFIEKLAMLLAHVFAVPSAKFDLQITFPSSLGPYVGSRQKEPPSSSHFPFSMLRTPSSVSQAYPFHQPLSARQAHWATEACLEQGMRAPRQACVFSRNRRGCP
jgi:hypothetical protein